MFMVIPTWLVTLNYGDAKGVTFRVPETNLDAFLRVMTFNKQEFEVAREPEPRGARNHAGDVVIPRPSFDLAAFYQAAARTFSDHAERLERAVERRNRGIREYQRRMRAAIFVLDAHGLDAEYLAAYKRHATTGAPRAEGSQEPPS